MTHMIKGNGAMQRPIIQQLQQNLPHPPAPPQIQGVIVGAVVNKPGTTSQASETPLEPGVTGIQGTPGILNVNLAMTIPGIETEEGIQNLANTKEKTPMCLVNELARYNKVQHQYTLTDEQGPAHKKTFFVKLKLGGEEYASSGASIKKAQHCAATIALEKTHYQRPPVRPPKFNPTPVQQFYVADDPNRSITPTVELNSLVMKRNEAASYRPFDMPRQQYYPQGAGGIASGGIQDVRSVGYNPRYGYPKFPRVFYVSLKVGSREFIGEGGTRQSARHCAAEKALKVLRALPLPDPPETPLNPEGSELGAEAYGPDGQLKSEISLVHEIALKRGMCVSFDVVRESGPPHLKNFLTRCSCGNITVDGEGNSKKTSKKRAAEAMLEKLNELPALPPSIIRMKKPPQNKKKNRNLIKKACPDYGMQINPISRLIQVQQAKKDKEPIYTLVAERGQPRKREFVVQVTVGEHQCQGVGPNKKLAKRNAAELMLQELGYSKPTPQPGKPAIKAEGHGAGDKKVTFIDQEASTTRQLVPGVILMPDKQQAAAHGYGVQGAMIPGRPGMPNIVGNHAPQTIAIIAKELLETRQSPTAEAIRQRAAPGTMMAPLIRPEQQLYYMGEVLCFAVQFTDFPKGNKNECLSLVTLSTVPPQVSHGAGPSRDASHDMAAHQALRALAMFDTLQPDMKKEMKGVDHRGDGLHVKLEQ